jgi:hypothetical protein
MGRERKLSHIIVPPDPSVDLSDEDDFKRSVFSSPLRAFEASTGMGRFNARYDVTAGRLEINVKVAFDFIDKKGKPQWTPERIIDFKKRFHRIIEDTWSERYTFACSKPGWEKYYARVFVTSVEDRSDPDYSIEVLTLNPGENGIQYIKQDTRTGSLLENCVLVDTTGGKRDIAAYGFKHAQIAQLLSTAADSYLPFAKNSSEPDTGIRLRLGNFVQRAQSVLTKEFLDAGFKLHVYGKAGEGEGGLRNLGLGKNRAKVVAAMLNERFRVKDLAVVVESAEKEAWVTTPVAEAMRTLKFKQGDITSRSFPGVFLLLKPPDPNATVKPGMQRNYFVAAHEFGHLVGLPDEYFGIQDHGMQKVMDPRTIIPDVYRKVTELVAKPDERRAKVAVGMAKLIDESGAPSPLFMDTQAVVTTSIMYAGAEVMPAHYLTFWEALCRMTFPYVGPQQWKIVPNKMGEGRRSDTNLFAAVAHKNYAK